MSSANVVQLPGPAAPRFRRVDRGRTHWYEWVPSGEHIPGVTTILGDGLPKPGLINWAAKATAEYAILRWDWLSELPDDERLRILLGSRFDDSDRAANRGTDVHRLAERWAAGADVEFPEELTGHIDSYIRFREEWAPTEDLVERPVLNATWGYAGTVDDVCLIGGHRTLLDIKTNRKGPYGDVALQAVAYGRAEYILDADGRTAEPMPAIDRYAVLWLRADGYDFYPLDIGEREWRVFLWVREVGRWIADRSAYRAPDPALRGALIGPGDVR
jgi:hypothetical protein